MVFKSQLSTAAIHFFGYFRAGRDCVGSCEQFQSPTVHFKKFRFAYFLVFNQDPIFVPERVQVGATCGANYFVDPLELTAQDTGFFKQVFGMFQDYEDL